MTCIDLSMVKALHTKMKGRRYKLGAKADQGGRSLNCDSADIPAIDCSGLTRYFIHKATHGSVTIPDGSINQLEWVEKHWRKLKQYSDVQYAAQDSGRLFIGFITPKPGKEWPRHVFILYMGRTMEAAGGSMKSVGSRKWSDFKNVAACFEIPVC